MDIKILDETKTSMRFELNGADHTLCNAIRKELWNDDKVKIAAYRVAHPLLNIPELFVEVKSGSPKTALKNCIKRLKEINSNLLKKTDKI